MSALRTDRAEYIAGVNPGACGGCGGSAVLCVCVYLARVVGVGLGAGRVAVVVAIP